MSSITCPRCGAQITLSRFASPSSKPFCARCGWNLERVEADLTGKSAMIPLIAIGIIALGLLLFFAASRVHSPIVFLLPAGIALIGVVPAWNYYSTRRAIAAAKFTANPSLAQSSPPLDPSLQMLQSLPRPRRVRFGFKGNIAAVVIVFVAIGVLTVIAFVAESKQPFRHDGPDVTALIPLLFVLLIFAILMVIPMIREKRNLPLLRDGELALARVTGQQTIQRGRSSYSQIDYEFQTSAGQSIRSSARDLTNAVYEDMTVPVFYDALDPARNVALCASYLKIADSFG